MSRGAWLLALAPMLGCGGAFGDAGRAWIDRPEAVSPTDKGALPLGLNRGDIARSLRAQAETELSCPRSQLRVSTPAADQNGIGNVVRGCGRVAEYLTVSWYEVWSEGLVEVSRSVNLHADPVAALRVIFEARRKRRPESHFSLGKLRPELLVEQWRLLLLRGAKDLHCPVAETLVGFHHAIGKVEWPVADGCGKRVTYLPTWAPFRARRIEPHEPEKEAEDGAPLPNDNDLPVRECR